MDKQTKKAKQSDGRGSNSQFFNDTLSSTLGFHMHFVYIAAIKNCEDLTVMLDIYSNQLAGWKSVSVAGVAGKQKTNVSTGQ